MLGGGGWRRTEREREKRRRNEIVVRKNKKVMVKYMYVKLMRRTRTLKTLPEIGSLYIR